jgi:predicted ATPase
MMTMPDQDASILGSLDRRQRRLLLSAIVEWIVTAAYQVPLVIAFEDLHWADPSTLELLHLLAERGAMAPLLLICTARTEFQAEWQHTQIALQPLTAYHAQLIVEQTASGQPLSGETVAKLVARAGGVPLFAEDRGPP